MLFGLDKLNFSHSKVIELVKVLIYTVCIYSFFRVKRLKCVFVRDFIMSVIAVIKSWFIEQPSVKVPSINEGITPEGYFLPWTEKKIREDKIIKQSLG